MPRVIVVGGGLAGLSAAAALGGAGFHVDVFESRGFLGGRATSFPLSPADPASEHIDNCQHVLLRCFVNLLDFYRRLGVADHIQFHREFHFLEPGGRESILGAGTLPAPAHFFWSFFRLRFLSFADKIGIARALGSVKRDANRRNDLDHITMLGWLREKRQTQRAIERFWAPVLVSAINEELDRMAASHGLQVFAIAFLGDRDSYEMGLSGVPLGKLYGDELWKGIPNVHTHLRSPVQRICFDGSAARGVMADGSLQEGDFCISAVPVERVQSIAPELALACEQFEHSPITGIHLWFDRPVMDVPHASLLDRTIQWAFNKGEGRYVQLVVSASRSLVDMPRAEVIALALRELGEFFPKVRQSVLLKGHVIKEVRATFSAKPGLEAARPGARTVFPNLFLAGDWTRTGWPATMEGAVRSGYLAAEALAAASGKPERFLVSPQVR